MRSLLILLVLIVLSDLVGITKNIDVRDLAVLYYFFRCMYLETGYIKLIDKIDKIENNKEERNGNN